MAANTTRHRLYQTEKTRQKIKTTKLLNYLHAGVFDEEFENKGKVVLTSEKNQAIKMLLAKAIPDLSSIQHSGDQQNPVKFTITND